jgi:integrase
LAQEWLSKKLVEVEALRRGDVVATVERCRTVDELLDAFLERHGRAVDVATKRKLTAQLRKARAEFGDRRPDDLSRGEVQDWRDLLPAGSRHDVFRAFRQALTWAVERNLCARDASARIKNPKRKRHERGVVRPFEDWAEVESVAAELDRRYYAIPIAGVGLGLRPEELWALHRTDIDRSAMLVHVQRRFTGGVLKQGCKPDGRVRTVPLRKRVLDALDAMPPRIDTPILFPAPRGGYIDIEKFRYREWTPALRAAGVEHHRIYDCRHTFATWAIDDEQPLSRLAMIMGTSVRELEDTYFRWLRRTDEELRSAFDAYDERQEAAGR